MGCVGGDGKTVEEKRKQGKLLFFEFSLNLYPEPAFELYKPKPIEETSGGGGRHLFGTGQAIRSRGEGYCQEIPCTCANGVPKNATLNCGPECIALCHEGLRDQCETCYPGYALTSRGVCIDLLLVNQVLNSRNCYNDEGYPTRNFWSSDGDIVSPDEAPCGCALFAERTACLDPEPTAQTQRNQIGSESGSESGSVYDCLGVPNGRAQMEACGCGDDTSCRDCRGEPDGKAEMKACGCEDDTSCRDCNGVPHGTAVELACGCMDSCPDGEGPSSSSDDDADGSSN